MNKKNLAKVTGTSAAAFLIAGTTAFTAFAAMPEGSVVIGNKAYSLEYANDPANAAEITAEIVAGGDVYVKAPNGTWFQNSGAVLADTTAIPAVAYKAADGKVTNYDAKDGNVSTPVSEALKVDSVSAINAQQIKIEFNQELDSTSAKTLANYAVNIKSGANLWDGTNAAVPTPKVTLDDSKKAVILTVETGYSFTSSVTNQKTLEVTVSNVKSADGKILSYYKNSNVDILDVTLPKFIGVTQVSPTKFDIAFSEPVTTGGANGSALATAIRVNDGKNSVIAQTSYDDATIPTNVIRINTGSPFAEGTYNLSINDAKYTSATNLVVDYAGFKLPQVDTTFGVTKDVVAPTVSVASASGTKVSLKFSEKVNNVTSNANIKFRLDYNNNSIESNGITYNAVTGCYDVTFAQPISAGSHGLYIHYVNASGTIIKDEALNALPNDTYVPFDVQVDNAAPVPTIALNATGTAIELTYNEDVINGNLQTSYEVKNAAGNTISYSLALKANTTSTYVLTPSTQPQGAVTVKILGNKVKDKSVAQNYVPEQVLTVDFGDKVAPAVSKVTKDATTATKIYVEFNESMSTEGQNSILNKTNYRISTDGTTYVALPATASVTLGVNGAKSTVITLTSGLAVTNVKVANVADLSGNVIDPFAVTATTTNADNVVDVLVGGSTSTTLGTSYLPASAMAKVVAKNKVEFYVNRQLAGVDASKILVNGIAATDIAETATFENVVLTAGDGITPIYGSKVTITLPTARVYGSAPTVAAGNGITINVGAFTTLNGTLSDGVQASGASGAAAEINTSTKLVDKIAPSIATDANLVAKVYALDHGAIASADSPNGKVDTIVVEFDEAIDKNSVSYTSFALDNYTVNTATVIATLNTTTFAELDSALVAANGKYVVLEVTPKVGVVVGTNDTPVVTLTAPVRDVAGNETTTNGLSRDVAGPVITAAKITAVGTDALWNEIGDVLTLTFSEAVVLNSALDSDPTKDGIQISAANLNALLNASTSVPAAKTVAYGATSTVNVTVDGKNVILTIGDLALTTGIDATATTEDTVKGNNSLTATYVTDITGNDMVTNGTSITVTK